MFSANSMNKFPRISTCSFTWHLPRMTNGRSLFVSNSRTQFKKSVRCSNESEFDFNAYRLEKVNSVNKALEAAIPLKEPLKIHEAMRYSVLSEGKRVFPLVCIACCELVGGTESIVMPIACAIEMFLTAMIITDDLPFMDNDDFRRGQLSNHKVFGESMTVLGGFALTGLGFEYIAKANKLGVSSANIVRVLDESARLLMGAEEGMVGGQAADIYYQNKSEIGIEQVEFIHLHKCSAPFEGSAISGAIVGGASEDEIKRLRKFCKYLGLLFQIKDDILDHEEDHNIGKATYPKVIGKDKSMELLEELTTKALNQLVGFDSKKAAPLKGLIQYILSRQE